MSRCFGVLRAVERKANYPKPKKDAVKIRTVELLIFPIILVNELSQYSSEEYMKVEYSHRRTVSH